METEAIIKWARFSLNVQLLYPDFIIREFSLV